MEETSVAQSVQVLTAGMAQFAEKFVGIVWSMPLVYLLLVAGLIFSVLFLFPQFRHFKHAIDIVRGKYDDPADKGEINHFQALCAALSATLGLGNIAGVAIAVSAGGPGAIFWMWIAGLLGMCTKFTSVALALYHREITPEGKVHGGPMFTIKNGLPKSLGFLAVFYAVFVVLSSFGAGNMFQSNQMASILFNTVGVPKVASGAVFFILAGLVLVGGIKRIGQVAGNLVPLMVAIYFIGAVGILAVNYEQILPMLYSIVHDAFNGTAAVGGFAGVAFKEVVVQGFRRGVFSNEAGMGSAAIAHSAAKSTPIQEGMVALLEPFIDTIVVCTVTALVILITGVWSSPELAQGSDTTAEAFAMLYGNFGRYMIMMTVVLFAFSTIISWSYYGEQGIVYLFGEKGVSSYRVVFLIFTFLGAVFRIDTVLNLSDAVFGLLAVPNLITNMLLAVKLRKDLKIYEKDLKEGRIKKFA